MTKQEFFEQAALLREGEREAWHQHISTAWLEAKETGNEELRQAAEEEFELFVYRWC